MRGLKKIQEAENELFEKVWLYRTLETNNLFKNEPVKMKKEVSLEVERLTKKYGKDFFTSSGYDIGMLEGKLSAIRWVLGSDWDMLDT